MSSSNPTDAAATKKAKETMFFDGGAHYSNLLANLLLDFTLLWLPSTLAAVFRGFYLWYRFIGEWGDFIITLKYGTKVYLRSVPKFREIAKYCLAMAEKPLVLKECGAKWF
ncbi:hypothetical protein BUALT_Bualt17G0067400 [Buddleja alternifolia]|uniref:Uncharacterized protein n=1 Tax=Buddleja alternifolia TaxID=168488 RepID=A0AAV6W848_9LAMI|nr:hypothetical protein BUALT_Bualt17G0067400 [Buddleja alternifolia]